MQILREEKQFITTIAVGVIALVWFYIVTYFVFNNNMLISINSVTWDNILIKLVDDYSSILFISTILLILNKKNLKDFHLCFTSQKEIFVLIVVMIILFFLHNDFTIGGFYKFFFYLVIISFGEEFLFRGFIYNRLKSKSEVIAIILSGIIWGIGHAILPSILTNAGIGHLLLSMCYEIGGGVVSGWYFIYIQEKSGSLWIPVLIHAILDYSVSYIGVFVAVITFAYFILKSKGKFKEI